MISRFPFSSTGFSHVQTVFFPARRRGLIGCIALVVAVFFAGSAKADMISIGNLDSVSDDVLDVLPWTSIGTTHLGFPEASIGGSILSTATGTMTNFETYLVSFGTLPDVLPVLTFEFWVGDGEKKIYTVDAPYTDANWGPGEDALALDQWAEQNELFKFDISSLGLTVEEGQTIHWTLTYGAGIGDPYSDLNVLLVNWNEDDSWDTWADYSKWGYLAEMVDDFKDDGTLVASEHGVGIAFGFDIKEWAKLLAVMTTAELNAFIEENLMEGEMLKVTANGIEGEKIDGKKSWTLLSSVDGDGNLIHSEVAGLEFKDVVAQFDIGAAIVVTSADDPVSITNSIITLSWSGKTFHFDLNPEELQALAESKEIDLSDLLEDDPTYVALVEELEKRHGKDFILANYGGFFGFGGVDNLDKVVLDVVVNNGTISFNIEDTPEGTWHIDAYNIHIDAGGATLNIDEHVVAVRQIDDVVEGVSSGGSLTKTGGGTLIIGGAFGETESGLNIGGNLIVTGGTLVLAGDRQLEAGEPNEEGNAITTHQAGNVAIEEGAVLHISTGATLNTSEIEVQKDAWLLVSSAESTNIIATTLTVEGGTVKIYKSDSKSVETEVWETSMSIVVGADDEKGTIDVDANVVFESGSVSGGDYEKTGSGTHIINGITIDGDLIVSGGTTILNATSGIQGAGRIVVGNADVTSYTIPAVLDLTGGALLELTNNTEPYDIEVLEKGTLRVSSTVGTGIFKGTLPHSLEPTIIFVDGGTVEIYKGEDEELVADTIHAVIGSKGGTINVAEDVIFESGTITAEGEGGDVIKTGEGTHRVGNVSLGIGTYDVKQGTVEFTGILEADSVKGSAGTTIAMTAAGSQNYGFAQFDIAGEYLGGGHNLEVGIGTVTGTMTEVGHLTVFDTFNLGNGSHSVETLTVDTLGTFDIKTGAVLQLTNDSSGFDIEVQGKLRIAAAEDTGLIKQDDLEFDIASSLFLNGGTIEIYKPEDGTDVVWASSFMDTTLSAAGGQFIVGEGIFFASNAVTGIGNYQKLGKGTHAIFGEFSIDGEMYIGDGTTTLYDSGNAAHVKIQEGTFEIAFGATFDTGTIIIQNGGTMINAGTVTADSLTLNNGTLELNLTYRDENEAEAMLFTDSLVLLNDVKIGVIGAQNQPGVHKYENLIEVTDGISSVDLEKLNGHQAALYRTAWTTTDNVILDLEVQILTVKEYADKIGWRQSNVVAVAGLFDAFLFPEESMDAMSLFSSVSMSSVDDIKDKLESLGGDPILQTELQAAMAGELVGNAARMVMGSPHRTLFRQLDALPAHTPAANRTMRGQTKSSPSSFRLWFNPYVQSEKGEADSTTYDGYSLTRAGFMIGGDTNLTNQIVTGVAFHYGGPTVKSDLGKIEADDYMIGAYVRVPVCWQITANGMIGYGFQKYTYNGSGGKIDFDGNAIFGSLELLRPFSFQSTYHLTPVVGLDFQSIGMDDLSVTLPTLGGMPINPDGLDTVMVRLGLQGACFNIRGRVQYIRQVSGDDFMASSISLGGTPATVRSVQWGKDWVNVGLGYDFVQIKNFRLSADYDLDAGKNVTSHIGSVSAVLTW